jgi:hypothetical protein
MRGTFEDVVGVNCPSGFLTDYETADVRSRDSLLLILSSSMSY